jgi:cyanate permease
MVVLPNPAVLLVIAVTCAFVGLHGALWSVHPTEDVWLFGSLLIGLLWGVAFLRLITRGKANG